MTSIASHIPESDEVEEFIKKTLRETRKTVGDDYGNSGYDDDEAKEMLSEVAAFFARRAREKAIEECQEKIRSKYGGDEDEGLTEASCALEELKSKPQ